MNIYHFTPYSLAGDLATEINKYVALVPRMDDYIVINDGDVMWTLPHWGNYIEKMIKANPEFDLLTVLATRIGVKEQRLNGKREEDPNLKNLAQKCQDQFNKVISYKAKQLKKPIGGYFLCFKKSLAAEIPFIPSPNGVLGVDGQWSQELLKRGRKIGICEKLTMVHWYRLDCNSHKDTEHLNRSNDTYIQTTVDKKVVIEPNMRGIMPNKEELIFEFTAGVPTKVPEFVANYYCSIRPNVFKKVKKESTELSTEKSTELSEESSEIIQDEQSGKPGQLNILVASNHLLNIAGSETFTYTIAHELHKQGHKVDIFTFNEGKVSKKLEKLGLKVNKLQPNYDLIIASHRSTVDKLAHLGFTIQICHGIYPKLEQPSEKANVHVAISKEVQDHVINLGFANCKLIHNSIDIKRFKATHPIGSSVRRVLSFVRSQKLNDQLKFLLEKRGIRDFTVIDDTNIQKRKWDTEKLINQADLVISLGRGAYEAMACGRPVLVLDARPYQDLLGDGIITKENYEKILEYNCSGRAFQRLNVEEMVDEALKYYAKNKSMFYRSIATSNFDVSSNVKKYINLK
jgi:hypothetical protein